MNQKIEIFCCREFGSMEVMEDGDSVWFPATKCARLLGFSDGRKAIKRHCRARRKQVFLTQGGWQVGYLISTEDLYCLIFYAKSESAQRFEDWIFEEILPTMNASHAHRVQVPPEEESPRCRCCPVCGRRGWRDDE